LGEYLIIPHWLNGCFDFSLKDDIYSSHVYLHPRIYSLRFYHRVFAFDDQINSVNFFGCLVVFLGVILYKVSLQITKNQDTYSTVDEDMEATIPDDSNSAEDTGSSSTRLYKGGLMLLTPTSKGVLKVENRTISIERLVERQAFVMDGNEGNSFIGNDDDISDVDLRLRQDDFPVRRTNGSMSSR